MFIFQANERNLYKLPFRWFLFGNNSFENYSKNLFQYNIELDSHLLIVTKSDDDEVYIINMIYKLDRFLNFNVTCVGNYTKNGSIVYNHINIYRYRRNVLGSTIRTSLVFTDDNSLNHLWDYKYINSNIYIIESAIFKLYCKYF